MRIARYVVCFCLALRDAKVGFCVFLRVFFVCGGEQLVVGGFAALFPRAYVCASSEHLSERSLRLSSSVALDGGVAVVERVKRVFLVDRVGVCLETVLVAENVFRKCRSN